MAKLFSLQDGYVYGKNIHSHISRNIPIGVAMGESHDLGILAECLVKANGGDHVEIGSLFGGSAILAALVKNHFNLSGKVYCVDPLDGYYGKGNKLNGETPNVRNLRKNIEYFGVNDRISIIPEPSIPWPVRLRNNTFSTGFIDGDHWGDAPYKDFISLNHRVSKFIQFDNYDIEHPDVVEATRMALVDNKWNVVLVSGISYVIQKDVNFVNPHKWASGNYD